MPIETFNLVLQKSYLLTPTIKHFVFAKEDNSFINFNPGQFVTFMLPTDTGLAKRRSYSLANMTDADSINTMELAASYIKGGIASELLFNLEPGAKIITSGPFGRLVIQEPVEETQRYILVATGTGITPYRSMLHNLLQRINTNKNFSVEVCFGTRTKQDTLYKDDFLEFSKKHENLNFSVYYSRENFESNNQESFEHKGYVQNTFDRLQVNPDRDIVYLCGNPNMIDDSFKALQEKGFSFKNVKREKYFSSN
ncbi:MAG: ferredoxin--NADP(+) reductase [Thiotrichales bacterium]|nr:MAG: ferredoxin--NADP(+) reductase [Thiotrichales bacterium]